MAAAHRGKEIMTGGTPVPLLGWVCFFEVAPASPPVISPKFGAIVSVPPSAASRRSDQGRGVAQPGSAHAWGACGRRFKSGRPDQLEIASARGRDAMSLTRRETVLDLPHQRRGAGIIGRNGPRQAAFIKRFTVAIDGVKQPRQGNMRRRIGRRESGSLPI